MTKKYDFLIYIGRMQPPTKAHVAIVNKALELSEKVIVLFGSCYQPRTIKNPWNFYERAAMLLSQIPPRQHGYITCRGLRDYVYNDQEWALQVQSLVHQITLGYNKPKIGIIGCKKDNSSFYLDMFPQWKLESVDLIQDVNATEVRNLYFENKLFNWKDKDLIDIKLQESLRDWAHCDEYKNLCEEYKCIQEYKKSWEVAPYPPTFVTTDAIVIQSGHVLLVQRKAAPGKGLWALPGGFLNQNESILDGVLRELKEETKLKVPTPVLKGSIIANRVFDNPGRSLRGRTITHAYVFQLPNGELNKVKGGDDAAKAKWFQINDALEMSELVFEDHDSIIKWGIEACLGK